MREYGLEKLIERAFEEDFPYGDLTTDALVLGRKSGKGTVTAKEDGVFAGGFVFKEVFSRLDEGITVTLSVKEGEIVQNGQEVITIEGPLNSILKGERIALNLLQRLSGIASATKNYVERIQGTKAQITDTRKTTPGLRALEKKAVQLGGGINHRFSLSDHVLIKDNHIIAAGGVKPAIRGCRKGLSHTVKVQVEVKNSAELTQAIEENADMILLDNMTIQEMKEAVDFTDGRAVLEASGNVTLERVEDIAKTGVDIISIGALTHSVKAMDFSLNIN
ncbi:carboxylating nicotinate-nucleotide diphosphorylase [Isachenkonia alkalipeptolytica]|uniref:Probable nicotinate-nucleotide pyrophosphorylase [carboxylating] n=1 Tax=Isachenkonia alkalipeptolytica TaxID=2565777 RepID=A0AA43XHX4_9CLOT|nr:carboxylating nicotinate-nucleotide diphosphorylase [Isachenkonia alkalipeptolytica]NBG87160.1 carboxylating nicotinate-nucleotide diphosphorylase [Isachenkonia alkalipeptolytica]